MLTQRQKAAQAPMSKLQTVHLIVLLAARVNAASAEKVRVNSASAVHATVMAATVESVVTVPSVMASALSAARKKRHRASFLSKIRLSPR